MPPFLRVSFVVVLVVMLSPMALATSPVTGELELPRTPALDGKVRVEAPLGVIDLRAGLHTGAVPSLTWRKAELTLMTNVRDQLGPTRFFVQDPAQATSNETTALEPGRLLAISCGEPCTAFAAVEAGGVVGIEGRSQGSLEQIGKVERYWTGFQGENPLGFYFETAPDWCDLRVGSDRGTPIEDGSAFARGPFTIVLWNVSAEIEGFGPIRTGTFVTQEHGPGGVLLRERSELRVAILNVTDGELTTGTGVPSTVQLTRPTLDLDGILRLRDVSGWLRVGPERRELHDADVEIQGATTLALQDGEALVPTADLGATDEAALSGRARRVTIDGERVSSLGSQTSSLTSVPVWIALVSLLLVGAYHAGIALYSRLDRSAILDNENRAAIYDIIRARPGVSIPAIVAQSARSEVVVRHHLRMLMAHGLILVRGTGRTKGWFPSDTAAGGRSAALALRDPSRMAIARSLARAGAPLSQRELADTTGLSVRLVSYHLAKLRADDLVEVSGFAPRVYGASAGLREAVERSAPIEQSGGRAEQAASGA